VHQGLARVLANKASSDQHAYGCSKLVMESDNFFVTSSTVVLRSTIPPRVKARFDGDWSWRSSSYGFSQGTA